MNCSQRKSVNESFTKGQNRPNHEQTRLTGPTEELARGTSDCQRHADTMSCLAMMACLHASVFFFVSGSAPLMAARNSYYAAIGSIRLGSLFLTLPTRTLTGQHVISSDGKGASRALSWHGSTGSSPSHVDHASAPRTTGIRLCNSAHSSLGVVVTMAKLRTHSPAGERQFSQSPANAIRPRSASAIA